jgi:nucleoside-diphosphate-sugar epimerase
MSKEIFITGATGFLGSSLIRKFLSKGYNVHALIRKNSDRSRLINLPNINYIESQEDYIHNFFKENQIDILIHTACNYGRGNESHKEILNTNINLGVELINLCDKFNVPLFINTHSTLPRNLNIYSSSKHDFKDILKKRKGPTKIFNFVFDHMYGPNDDENKFVLFLIKKILSNESIQLTKCEQKRDFIYIDDLVKAYFLAVENFDNSLSQVFYEYEVSSGEVIVLKDFVNELFFQLSKHDNLKNNINFGAIDYRKGEQMNISLDSKSLYSIGWEAKTNLSCGIKKVINSQISSN